MRASWRASTCTASLPANLCVFLWLLCLASFCNVPCIHPTPAPALPPLPCSNDPAAKGAPSGFTFSVREVRVAAGAGWLIAVCGDMMMIPGLPTRPAFYEIDIDPETGRVLGLS